MRLATVWMVIVLLTFILAPHCALGQTVDPPKPPTCCNNGDPPPPPPGASAVTMGGDDANLMPQISISDATLHLLGMTRSQFLDRQVAALFGDSFQTVYIVIPVWSQVTSSDGSVVMQVTYYQIQEDLSTPLVIDAQDLCYLTDGQITIKVTFIENLAGYLEITKTAMANIKNRPANI